jgi:hypothetical protein
MMARWRPNTATHEGIAYTTLVPFFLAWLKDRADFIKLVMLDAVRGPSTLRPLVLDALAAGMSPGGFGSCCEYYEKLAEILGSLECVATKGHCAGIQGKNYLDPSYYFYEIDMERLGEGFIGDEKLEENTRVETRFGEGRIIEQKRSKQDETGKWTSLGGFRPMVPVKLYDFKNRVWSAKYLRRVDHFINIKGAYPSVTHEIYVNLDILFGVIDSPIGSISYSLRDKANYTSFLNVARHLILSSLHEKAEEFAEFFEDFIRSVVERKAGGFQG